MNFDVSLINTGLIIVGGIVLIFQQRQNKATNISSEVIEAYEKQVAQLKEEVKQLRDLYTKSTDQSNKIQAENVKQMNEIQSTVNAKDSQIKALTDLVQNRNPELERILTEISKFLHNLSDKVEIALNISSQNKDYLAEAKRRHDEIDREFGPRLMKEIKAREENTERSKKNEARNIKIDKATQDEEGHVLRNK